MIRVLPFPDLAVSSSISTSLFSLLGKFSLDTNADIILFPSVGLEMKF